MRLEHVGIAVRDVETALETFESLLGSPPYKMEEVESEGVATHFFRAGDVKIELLESMNADSSIARFLENRGEGLHHLAFEVDDLDAARDRLTARGFRLVGNARRPGADGKSIFFLHPKDTAGVLIECCAAK